MAAVWPNFFLIGAPKAGTTTVFEYLAGHPEVFCPIVKEPNFFNTDMAVPDAPSLAAIERRRTPERAHFACIRDESAYTALYRDAGAYPARGDCSVNYLYSTVAAQKIRAAVPDARLIAILRDPVERAFSHYLMDAMIGRVRGSFMAEIDRQLQYVGRRDFPGENYLDMGLYMPQLRRYFDAFGREPLLILLFDDLARDPAAFMARIFRHINVAPRPIAALTWPENVRRAARFEQLNAMLYRTGLKRFLGRIAPARLKDMAKRLYYTGTVSEQISNDDRRRLREVFRRDVQAVSETIGRDLGAWLA